MIREGELERRIRELGPWLPEANRDAVLRETERLASYLAQLLAANERMNLVSASAARPEELVGRHLLEALSALQLLPAPRAGGLKLLDIGSGGGLPAVPLLIVRGDIRGTLVESTLKKCRFLAEACGEVSLHAEVVSGRFPETFRMRPRSRFDVLTSRAVARAGRLVRAARLLLARSALILLWTTEDLLARIRRDSGEEILMFHRTPGSRKKGIALLGGTERSSGRWHSRGDVSRET